MTPDTGEKDLVQADVQDSGAVTPSLVEPDIDAVAALLLGSVNAPEGKIYELARTISNYYRLSSQGRSPEGWVVECGSSEKLYLSGFSIGDQVQTAFSPDALDAIRFARERDAAYVAEQILDEDFAYRVVPRAPQPPEGGTGWRDISSAPRDRSPILLDHDAWEHPVVGRFAPSIGMFVEHGTRDRKANIATRWVPLPSPPGQGDRTDSEMRWVACEACGGSGEVEVRPNVGPYGDPTPCAEICTACEGTGRDCVEVTPAERDDDGQDDRTNDGSETDGGLNQSLPEDEVICPACAHNFRAVSQADQDRLRLQDAIIETQQAEIERLRAIYESAATGRRDFRQASRDCRASNNDLREALQALLDCPDIADVDDADKDPETVAAERKARASRTEGES